MISDSHRFIYVHIPRTGGTSVEIALAACSRTPIGVTAHECTVLPYKHATAAELRAVVGAEWDRYYRFSVVRNPWARMVSDYYFFRQAGPKLYPEFSPRERELTDAALRLDFNQWLHEGAAELKLCQLDYLTDEGGALIVDHVGRMETLADDFAQVCRHLGVRAELPRLNAVRRPPIAEVYDDRSVRLIERWCAADIERFGYRFG
ncbi:MAG: sulfotransferase family 2 domain-containing protein [Nannocystaceae bacterium]